MFSSESSSPLRVEGLLELAHHPPVVQGVEGPVEAQAQAARGDRPHQQVVDEGEPAQHLVARGAFRHRHQQRARGPPALQPGLQGLLVGGDGQRLGQEERAPGVSLGLRLLERVHLDHGQSGRQIARDEVPGFSPHQDVGHSASQAEVSTVGRGSRRRRACAGAEPRSGRWLASVSASGCSQSGKVPQVVQDGVGPGGHDPRGSKP